MCSILYGMHPYINGFKIKNSANIIRLNDLVYYLLIYLRIIKMHVTAVNNLIYLDGIGLNSIQNDT